MAKKWLPGARPHFAFEPFYSNGILMVSLVISIFWALPLFGTDVKESD